MWEVEKWLPKMSTIPDAQTCECSSAAAAKSLQSCPTLCDPIDGSPPGFAIPGILQARMLEWVAISFSNAWKWKVKVKLLSRCSVGITWLRQSLPCPLKDEGFCRSRLVLWPWTFIPILEHVWGDWFTSVHIVPLRSSKKSQERNWLLNKRMVLLKQFTLVTVSVASKTVVSRRKCEHSNGSFRSSWPWHT